MTAIEKIEHARIHAEDLDDAVEFYVDTMGLVEIDNTSDTVYLGCGLDSNFDVALVEGGTGLDHVAFRVTNEAALRDFEETWDDAGVEYARTTDLEPGEIAGIKVRLPSQIQIELVAVEEDQYPHASEPAQSNRNDVAPVDFDHVNFISPAIEDDVEFLKRHLSFRVSEIVGPMDDWNLVFTRCGKSHHDIAISGATDEGMAHASLHHTAWKYRGIEHMKVFLDRFARTDLSVERGLGRHFAGDNLYTYIWTPDGNRIELAAEMAEVHTDNTAHIESRERAAVAWGAKSPKSFNDGSGLVSVDE